MVIPSTHESSTEFLANYKRMNLQNNSAGKPLSPSSSLNRRRLDFPDVGVYQRGNQLIKMPTQSTVGSAGRSPGLGLNRDLTADHDGPGHPIFSDEGSSHVNIESAEAIQRQKAELRMSRRDLISNNFPLSGLTRLAKVPPPA